jgi:L-threonylcarbamoyladenylate synthase
MDKLDLSKAISALTNGEIIVYPTDTLYGLGADIYNVDAIRKVFEVKKRPMDNPLSVAVSSFDELKQIAYISANTKRLVESFLPGKLTLILIKRRCVSDVVTGGLDKIAVRIPNCKVTLELLSEFGPLTATSANIHGTKTPGIINDIRMQFKDNDIAVYLDIGKLDGQPSTIVDMTGKKIKILREGTIAKRDILDAI